MPPKRNVRIQRVTPTDDISFANKEKYYDEIFTEISRNCGSEFLAHLQTEDELLKRNLINREYHRKEKREFLKKSKKEEMDVLTDSMSAVVFLTTVWGLIICPIFEKSPIVLFVYFVYIFFIYIMTFFLYRKKYWK